MKWMINAGQLQVQRQHHVLLAIGKRQMMLSAVKLTGAIVIVRLARQNLTARYY